MENSIAAPTAVKVVFNRYLAQVYLVMSLGMAITALVATEVSSNKALLLRIVSDPWFAFGLFLVQMVVVVVLAGAVMRLSTGIGILIFLGYSALTGISISSIFIYYTQSDIAYTFWLTAGMFLLSSVVGFFIKRDLSGASRFLLMALMGWTFAYFFSWFFPSAAGFNRSVNFFGILLFAALTVWDTQRLKQLSEELKNRQVGGLVVIGALTLYLDYINMFLLILRSRRQ